MQSGYIRLAARHFATVAEDPNADMSMKAMNAATAALDSPSIVSYTFRLEHHSVGLSLNGEARRLSSYPKAHCAVRVS